MTKQEYIDMYDVVGAAMEVYNTLGESDDFILLNQDNYKAYIDK